MKEIQGGITSPGGFRAGVTECGIKRSGRPDLALIVSDRAASAAGMFTSNRVKGAPILVSRENVKSGSARAIIANSGNANVCNGEEGIEAALAMTGKVAKILGCEPSEVLVASTGVIGKPFPIDKVLKKIPDAYSALSSEGSQPAARAIMTTDTFFKETAVELQLGENTVRIGAIAKGSGMIKPDLATMLCFITTDADIESSALKKALQQAVDSSFNRITVDGDMSTSDTVLILANGVAGNPTIRTRSKAFEIFTEALSLVCSRIAKLLVKDGEGATKFISINVTGAAGREEARQVGLTIANSPLVKTAFFGNDPNWGRIICAAGYSGVCVDESHITIVINGTTLFESGRAVPFDEKEMREKLSSKEINVSIDLGMGQAEDIIYTTDLTYDYIKINAEYTT